MQLIIIFSWQIRHVTFPALDDSRCLLLGSGLTLTLVGVVCIVMLLFPDSDLALSAVISVLLWLGTTAILIIIFLPKVNNSNFTHRADLIIIILRSIEMQT